MIGQRIAVLRRASGMSQADLAQALQVSPSTVGMYEQGRREPAAQTLVTLARLFQVTTDYLLTGQPSSGGDAETLAEIFDRCLQRAEQRLSRRKEQGFSRQELATFFAAMLLEP